jgi:hypothetical protein
VLALGFGQAFSSISGLSASMGSWSAFRVRVAILTTVGVVTRSFAAIPPAPVRADRHGGHQAAVLAEALVEGYTRMRADTDGIAHGHGFPLRGRAPAACAAWCERNAGAF